MLFRLWAFIVLCFTSSAACCAPAFWDLYMANPPVDFGSAADAAGGYVNWRNSTKTCTNGCYYVLGNVTTTTATKVGYKVRLFNGSGVEQTPIYVDFVPHCRVGGVVKGATVVDGVATCPDVTCPPNKEIDPDTQLCTCKSLPNAGSFMVSGDVFQGCNSGCGMLLQSGWYDKTSNTTWGSWSQTGSACTAGEPSVLSSNDPKVEAAKQCAAGTCPGTVNGQSVCVPCDKSKETGTGTKTESSSTTASGASTPGTSSTSSESTSTRTECSNGSCTTTETTTVTGPNGDKTDKTTTTSEPQSDYCTRNPRADVCKGTESSWGGSCESGFTCDGDAVQCAQARASYELRCKITETDSEVIGKYNALKAEGLEGLHLPAMNITPPTPEAFGACPIQDVTIDLGFGPMPFPLSYVCPYLEVIHRVVTSFGALFWLLIVFLKGD